MNTNSNLTSNPLSSMKWSEIPDATPVTALMSAVGYPEPMVILKHLSKPNKNGKKTDLSAFVQFMCLTKGNVDKLLFAGYQAIVGNSKVHTFL